MTRGMLILILCAAALAAGCSRDAAPSDRLVIGVCDPLAKETASDCVKPKALREYDGLAARLSAKLGIPVTLRYLPFDAQVAAAVKSGDVNALIVKTWTLLRARKSTGRAFERLADLRSPRGDATLTGVFIVRKDSPLAALRDLDGKALLVGPDGAYEKSFAARRALAGAGASPGREEVVDGCVPLAAAVIERRADAGVVSSYVVDFGGLEMVAEPGQFRELARTAPAPFMTFAVSTDVSEGRRDEIRRALLEMTGQDVPKDLYTTGFTEPAPWEPEELTR